MARSSGSPHNRSSAASTSTRTTSRWASTSGRTSSARTSARSTIPAAEMRHFAGSSAPTGGWARATTSPSSPRVNCSASVCQFVPRALRATFQRDYPNVDGVIAITHKSGCGVELFGEDHEALERVLGGYARHPNVAAYVMIGLGCEVNQVAAMSSGSGRSAPRRGRGPLFMTIQESGGVRKTVEAGGRGGAATPAGRQRGPAHAAADLASSCWRTNCGGSDGNSGITANPALGWASDELVRYGGTGVLAETPEIYGAEHLLIRRAVTEEVAEKLIDRYQVVGGTARGIEARWTTTRRPETRRAASPPFSRSPWAASPRAAPTPLTDVFLYGEPITTQGVRVHGHAGLRPGAHDGLVAGGRNMGVFTTGRGSVFGCRPAPSIKVATNTPIYRQHGRGHGHQLRRRSSTASPLETVGRQIFEKVWRSHPGRRPRASSGDGRRGVRALDHRPVH